MKTTITIGKRSTFLLTAFALGLMSPAPAKAQNVADSKSGFSDQQGLNGWFYGYYPIPGDSASFTTWGMGFEKDWNNIWQGPFLCACGTNWFPIVGPEFMHPWDQWSIRRWVSDFTGDVVVSGEIYMGSQDNGDGVTQRIFHNGTEVYAQSLAYNDRKGYEFAFVLSVAAGDTIDFASDPNGNSGWDSNFFSSRIDTTLLEDLAGLIQSAGLSRGVENRLWGQLQAALNALSDVTAKNDQAGCQALARLAATIESLVGDALSEEVAASLLIAIGSLEMFVGCE